MGHQLEAKHLDLTKKQKVELAARMLAAGLNVTTVMEHLAKEWEEFTSKKSIEENLSQQDLQLEIEMPRFFTVTSIDLGNIRQEFNLRGHVHKNEFVALETIVELMNLEYTKKQLPSPILKYVPFTEVPNKTKKSFFLIVMTQEQKDLLRKYGNGIVAIDATHGTSQHDLQLSTLMVLDENRFVIQCRFVCLLIPLSLQYWDSMCFYVLSAHRHGSLSTLL